MINCNLAGDALVHCLKVSRAKVLMLDAEDELKGRAENVRERIEGGLNMTMVILTDSLKSDISNLEPSTPDQALSANMSGDSPMGLFYTSGTTGLSKACVFPMAQGWFLGGYRIESVRIKPGPNGDRWYNCMPMYHGTGGTVSVTCLTVGVTLCIGKRFSTTRFWDDIRDSRATAFVYVGETARYLLAAPPSPKDKEHDVRLMFGNGLRPDVWTRFQERFDVPEVAEFFNSTEGVFGLLNYTRGEYLATAVGHHGYLFRQHFNDIYVPVKTDLLTGEILRDPSTGFAKRSSYEEGGEIFVAIPDEKAFQGYFNAPATATAQKFARDVFRKGDLYYRTGDALRRTPDGRWFFLDRLGDTFRWKGHNVSTAEVAECLGRFAGIVEANVYGVEVPGHDGRAGHARDHLPGYAVPVFLRVIDQTTSFSSSRLHLNGNNKQIKGPLRAQGVDPAKVDKGDRIMWLRPGGDGKKKGKEKDGVRAGNNGGYVDFTPADWEGLVNGGVENARL
ncbi:MAG: hypothetical protein M1819_004071 [Sarea resinae]|nr:MAG: hypothetical protein M1819_004071 [Sarea resinae]